MNDLLEKLRNLLVTAEAFDEPFRPSVESRLLLFPTDGFLLGKGQFEALGATAGRFGDKVGYCIITEGIELEVNDQLVVHMFDLQDYSTYRELQDSGCVLQENVLISDSGSWVVMISQEFHALLGCSCSFLEEFIRLCPKAIEDFDRFVEAWESNSERIGSDITWLPRLTAHLQSKKL